MKDILNLYLDSHKITKTKLDNDTLQDITK